MTIHNFCTSGEQEEVKGAVHALAGVLALVMATYNVTAWCYRRQSHLGTNAVIYTAVVAWEVRQTLHHLRRSPCAQLPHAA
jgi:hypothetical protein